MTTVQRLKRYLQDLQDYHDLSHLEKRIFVRGRFFFWLAYSFIPVFVYISLWILGFAALLSLCGFLLYGLSFIGGEWLTMLGGIVIFCGVALWIFFEIWKTA